MYMYPQKLRGLGLAPREINHRPAPDHLKATSSTSKSTFQKEEEEEEEEEVLRVRCRRWKDDSGGELWLGEREPPPGAAVLLLAMLGTKSGFISCTGM